MTMRKVANIFEFFKSTLAVNIAVCVLPLLFNGLVAFNYAFLSYGFLLSLAVKEVNSKNEYLFYYNNQISKTQLWVSSWAFSFLLLIAGIFIYKGLFLFLF